MSKKNNPRNSKILPIAGLFMFWFLLLISPFGHIVAIVTVVGWIVIFIILGLIRVKEPSDF